MSTAPTTRSDSSQCSAARAGGESSTAASARSGRAPVAQASRLAGSRTTSTGTVDACATRSATLPRSQRVR
ncbi:hypothetical protein L6R52_18370 [Myxococcota bacterium]|nr:hypothetical protein [Myxococcota bacterium]